MTGEVPAELVKAAWARVAPSIEQRVVVLEAFVLALDGGSPAGAGLEVVRTEAHRLAGSLGSYGLAEGTARAREVESLLGETPLDAASIGRAVAALAEIVSRGPV